jgi:hypothetical protein
MNGGSPLPPVDSEAITKMEAARAQLKSVSDADEDTGRIEIPQDAPRQAKVILGFASGLTPNGRLIIGLALIAAVVVLILRGVKLF